MSYSFHDCTEYPRACIELFATPAACIRNRYSIHSGGGSAAHVCPPCLPKKTPLRSTVAPRRTCVPLVAQKRLPASLSFERLQRCCSRQRGTHSYRPSLPHMHSLLPYPRWHRVGIDTFRRNHRGQCAPSHHSSAALSKSNFNLLALDFDQGM